MPVVRLNWPLWGGTVALLLLGIGGLGCNVYDDVGPAANSVDILLSDARTALAADNPQRAVRLLETAHEKDSTNAEVRVELANALYATHDLTVFTLRAVVERMNGKDATADVGKAERNACTEGAAPPRDPARYETLAVEDADSLSRLASHQTVLHRVSRLLVDGVLRRRPDAFGSLSPEMQAKAELLAALTRLGRRLVAVRAAVVDTESRLHLDTEAAPPALLACSPTAAQQNRAERGLCRLREGGEQALSWLRSRNDRVHSQQSGVLIGPLTQHVAGLQRLSCGGGPDGRLVEASSQFRPHE
jgi:hypothetical protein